MLSQVINAERYDAGTNEEYHAGEGVSNSMLSVAIRNIAEYHGIFVDGSIPRSEPTADMQTGTNLHDLVLLDTLDAVILDPSEKAVSQEVYDTFKASFDKSVVVPANVLNAQGHCKGKAYTEWAAEHKGKTPVKEDVYAEMVAKLESYTVIEEGCQTLTHEQYDELLAMRNALYAHDAARALLFGKGGEPEVPIRGQDSYSGLNVRCKIDRLWPGMSVDLKTTKDASPKKFASSVFDFGYHRQQVFYSRLVEALTGSVLPFMFVAIEKKRPYRVETYKLADEWLEIAEKEIDDGLTLIADCQASGIWQPPHYGEILTLPAPFWAKKSEEWQTA